MHEISVRFATDADIDWCRYTLTLDSNFPNQQLPGLSELIVAELDDQLVGVLHLAHLWPGGQYRVPYISGIIVIKEYQRRGIGKALLYFLENLLLERGQRVLLSSCVVNEHEPQAWHRHVGFKNCGDLEGIPFDDGLGEVFFYKRLKQ